MQVGSVSGQERRRTATLAAASVLLTLGVAALGPAEAKQTDCSDEHEPNDTIEEATDERISFRGHDGSIEYYGGLCAPDDIDFVRFFTERPEPWVGSIRLVASTAITAHMAANGGAEWYPLPIRQFKGGVIRVAPSNSPMETPMSYELRLQAFLLSPTPRAAPSETPTPTAPPGPPPIFMPLTVTDH